MIFSSEFQHSQRSVKRLFIASFAVWFAILSVTSHSVFAQSASTDFESPIIEHEPLASGNWGDVQVFEASVVDNDRIKRVRLFYRYSGDLEFTELEMQQLASSSSYTVSIDTGELDEPRAAIEYYIRAEDASDNLVLKGFAFEPLVRTLIADVPVAETPVPAPVAADTQEPQKKGINWLYVALGVLVVGGIAAGAGGGSDGGSEPPQPTECDPNCTVTLSISTP